MGLDQLVCFFDAVRPTDTVGCLTTSSVVISSIVFIAMVFIFIAGWAYYRDFVEGMLIGSFGGMAVGLGMIILEWLTVDVWLVSVVLFIVSLMIVVIRKSGGD